MQAGAGLQPAPVAGRRRPSHWLKLLPQYVNALSPPIASDVQNTLKKYFEITKIKYSYKVF